MILGNEMLKLGVLIGSLKFEEWVWKKNELKFCFKSVCRKVLNLNLEKRIEKCSNFKENGVHFDKLGFIESILKSTFQENRKKKIPNLPNRKKRNTVQVPVRIFSSEQYRNFLLLENKKLRNQGEYLKGIHLLLKSGTINYNWEITPKSSWNEN